MNPLRIGQVLRSHPNPWRLPEMPMIMEGPVPDDELARMAADTEARVAAWSPSAEGWSLLDTLEGVVRRRVEIQAWDPMMIWLDDEGPYPIRARLVGVERPQNGDGHPVPNLLVAEVTVARTPMGYDGRDGLLQPRDAAGDFAFRVASLFSIKLLRERR